MPDRDTTITTAKGLAARHQQRTHPASTEDEAWAWAERHWRRFVDQAIDALALMAAVEEAHQAAATN